MQWELTYGSHVQDYLDLLEEGYDVECLNNRPDLWTCNRLAWNCYSQLDRGRSAGMQVNAIPFADIAAWCNLFDVYGDAAERLVQRVQVLDSAYLKHVHEKQKQDST